MSHPTISSTPHHPLPTHFHPYSSHSPSHSHSPSPEEYNHSVLRLLNERFGRWEDLVAPVEGSASSSSRFGEGSGSGSGRRVEEDEDVGDGWGLDDDEDDLMGDDAHQYGGSGSKRRKDTIGATNDGEMGMDIEDALDAEIMKWRTLQLHSEQSLSSLSSELSPLLHHTLTHLQSILHTTSSLTTSRYGIIDQLSRLQGELVTINPEEMGGDEDMTGEGGDMDKQARTILESLEESQERLRGLGVGLRWVSVLEGVMLLAQQTLTPKQLSKLPETTPTPSPSPIPSLQPYKSLHTHLSHLTSALSPQSQTQSPQSPQQPQPPLHLLQISHSLLTSIWAELVRRGQLNLAIAAEGIGWAKIAGGGAGGAAEGMGGVSYEDVGVEGRRGFERGVRELLVLQREGEALYKSFKFPTHPSMDPNPINVDGVYAIQKLMEPIRLRFIFHFEGERSTNRLDKPEWAFSSILDTLHRERGFVVNYLQPLLDRSGFSEVDALSELTAQILQIPLTMLIHRFPHLLPHPALLAHTVYQTVLFDDAIRRNGYDVSRTWKEVRKRQVEGEKGRRKGWEGLTVEVLGVGDWFERWWTGERSFAMEQYEELTGSPEAWTLVDPNVADGDEEEGSRKKDFKPTMAARQLKALVEQVADRYAALPTLRHKYPFLSQLQLPLLKSYHDRISASLDAFETLASTFARAVPGALAGHTRDNGVAMDPGKMTNGVGGLQRLAKAWISGEWLRQAMEEWGDELLYLTISSEIASDPPFAARARHEGIDVEAGDNPFGGMLHAYAALTRRAESMIVKHVTAEVERDLKTHLTRRWDGAAVTLDKEAAALALIGPLTTLSAHLSHLCRTMPSHILGKLYRSIVGHISNHILQRAVYAGWSKFTSSGGLELTAEVEAWIEASRLGLDGCKSIRRVELPWESFRETAKILSLPKEMTEGEPFNFVQAVALAFDSQFGRFSDEVGIKELDQVQTQMIMKRRVDCYR